MDDTHLLAAARYIELNPVRAGLVTDPRKWLWSIAPAHLAGTDDRLVKVAPLTAMNGDWDAFLKSAMAKEEPRNIRQPSRTGRPLGDEAFLDRLEGMVGRFLKPRKPGPKSQRKTN